MREYDRDFKEEAIKLSYELGLKAAADKFGIPQTTLSTWRRQTRQYGEIAFVGSGNKRIDPKMPKSKLWKKR